MRPAAVLVIVSVSFLSGCSKDGVKEINKAMAAMENTKSFRLAASSKSSPEEISEFMCPNRARVWESGRSGERVEMVLVGRKGFTRPAGTWIQDPDTLSPVVEGKACLVGLRPFFPAWPWSFVGANYLGQDTVAGTPCDSWVARANNYDRPAPGRYHDDRAVREIDFVVCINPSNHLILQIKRADEVWRYYDFNSPDISIPDPGAAQ